MSQITYFKYADTGEYLEKHTCAEQFFDTTNVKNIYVGDVDMFTHYHDVEKNTPVPMPDKPAGDGYVFNYSTKSWDLNQEELLRKIRSQRAILMMGSDWRVTKAMETGIPMSQEWIDYRQALRDITETSDLSNLVWPTAPSS